jgi:hypothetical protein
MKYSSEFLGTYMMYESKNQLVGSKDRETNKNGNAFTYHLCNLRTHLYELIKQGNISKEGPLGSVLKNMLNMYDVIYLKILKPITVVDS